MAQVPQFTGKGLYRTGVANQRLVSNNVNDFNGAIENN